MNKKNNHIIITGGAGFIGSHIANRMLSQGYRVTVLDNLSTGREENIPIAADFIKLDLGESGSYSAIENISCDAILHLAGQSSGEASFNDPLYDLKSHVMSTFWLLEWAKKRGTQRFLYASSMSIYGDPVSLPVNESHTLQPKTFYAASKASAENYIKLYQTFGLNTTIFRLFSVYGPGQNLENKAQGIVSIYLSYMLEGLPVPVKGSKERFRDLVYIDDVVDAWMTSFDNPVSFGKVYNIASGKRTTVEELLNALKIAKSSNDYPIEYKESTPGDQFGVVGDNTLITGELGWKPQTDLYTGLKNMFDYEKRRKKSE